MTFKDQQQNTNSLTHLFWKPLLKNWQNICLTTWMLGSFKTLRKYWQFKLKNLKSIVNKIRKTKSLMIDMKPKKQLNQILSMLIRYRRIEKKHQGGEDILVREYKKSLVFAWHYYIVAIVDVIERSIRIQFLGFMMIRKMIQSWSLQMYLGT